MARLVALIPDLLFGSRVQGALSGAGHEVRLVADPSRLDGQLADADALIVDLNADGVDPAGVASLAGELGLLGFYAHVQPEVRERALSAGFDVVVPRSRMARETAQLIDGLLSR
jgi:hypothetical protein